jgi:Tfp pilus assembly protein PilP
MKKVLITLLFIAAVAVYVWDAFLLVRSFKGDNAGSPATEIARQTLAPMQLARAAHFIECGKNPFLPYKEASKPKLALSAQSAPFRSAGPKLEARPLPAISINGIMWSETNPVAIINLPDGSSTVAKPGQTILENVVIKKIEKGQVTVVFEKKQYTLK